jgi:hypothetical protein
MLAFTRGAMGSQLLMCILLVGPAAAQSPMTAFEQEQVTLKERELGLERQKAWLTAMSVLAAAAAAVLAYWSSRKNQLDQAGAQLALQEKTALDNFQLKAAEIAMAGRTSWDAKGRAIALAALFPGRLPSQLGADFDPEKYTWGRESKRELLSLLAANAADRKVILKTWAALFPHDDWIDSIPADL